MDFIWNSIGKMAQKVRCHTACHLFLQFHMNKFQRAVDGNQKIKLALCGAQFCEVDVEVADRISLKIPPVRLAAIDGSQA